MFSRKTALTLSVIIVILCVVIFKLLTDHGKSSRVYLKTHKFTETEFPVHIIRTAPELYAFYKQNGVRGRVIVNVGRFLHFRDMGSGALLKENDRFPIRLFDVALLYEKEAELMSYLWVAMRTGLVREIYHLVPAEIFAEKRSGALRDNTDVISVSDHEITAHYWGGRRTISDHVPDIKETIILNVDASYFKTIEPGDFARSLINSGLAADIVTIYLAEDNPEVGASERERLRIFASLLAGKALNEN